MYLADIKKLLEKHHSQSVFDVWAGRGEYAGLASKMGAEVVALDSCSRKDRQWNQKLDADPNIVFIRSTIEDFFPKLSQNFDMILLLNIIAFLDKEYFLNVYFPKLMEHTNKSWIIVVNFFFEDDPTMQKVKHYDFQDFDPFMKNLNVIEKKDTLIEDDHQPYGIHKHHVWYLVFQKK